MIRTIPASQLRLGMYIHNLNCSWMKHPFWRSSFLLERPDDLQRILASGINKVEIDLARSIDGLQSPGGAVVMERASSGPAVSTSATSAGSTVPAVANRSVAVRVSMAEEMRRAAAVCERSRQAIFAMFSDVRLGKAVSGSAAQAMVEEIADSVSRNPDALITLARLKTSDNYTYMHSVAVCALMIALGRELGMTEEDVRGAGTAGLLHDVGKMFIPPEILNKPGSLSEQEFATIRNHPGEGAIALTESGEISDKVIDVCLHHHEKVDGSGYPDGLSGEQISELARMGAVCDVYDAITSTRPYKQGWSPAESIHRMAQWSGGHFDSRIFQAFVKSVGIYPTGSLVRLESERLGVVLDQHESSLLTPLVKVFFSVRSGMPIEPRVIDLGKEGVQDHIVCRESPGKWGFRDLDSLWR